MTGKCEARLARRPGLRRDLPCGAKAVTICSGLPVCRRHNRPGSSAVTAGLNAQPPERAYDNAPVCSTHEALVAALRRLVSATEEAQSSDPQMPSHADTEQELDAAIDVARAALDMPARDR